MYKELTVLLRLRAGRDLTTVCLPTHALAVFERARRLRIGLYLDADASSSYAAEIVFHMVRE